MSKDWSLDIKNLVSKLDHIFKTLKTPRSEMISNFDNCLRGRNPFSIKELNDCQINSHEWESLLERVKNR